MLYQLTQIQEDRLKHLLASLESSLFRFRLSCLDLCLSYGRFFDSLFDRYDEGGSHDRNRKSNRHRGNQTTRETEWREGKMTMIHKYNVAVIIPARGQRESRRNYIHRTRVVPPITAGELAAATKSEFYTWTEHYDNWICIVRPLIRLLSDSDKYDSMAFFRFVEIQKTLMWLYICALFRT